MLIRSVKQLPSYSKLTHKPSAQTHSHFHTGLDAKANAGRLQSATELGVGTLTMYYTSRGQRSKQQEI